MKRGEIWTVTGGPDYAGKPRPAVIIQSNKFDATRSVTICPLTTTLVDASPARFTVQPSLDNGLDAPSHVMADKISTVPKQKLGRKVGQLSASDVLALNRTVAVFLHIIETPGKP